MTFVNISNLAPLVVIVKLHMTNGILKPGTLRLDSVMVYHPSHTSAYFNRPRLCRCRRTCVNSQVHTFVICICRSTSCTYANAHALTFVCRWATFARIASDWRRGDGISRWLPRLFPRVLPPVGIDIAHFVAHTGLGGEPSGDSSYGWICHVVTVEGITQGLKRAKVRSVYNCHNELLQSMWK